MPNRRRIFVGLPGGERDDFDFSKLIGAIKAKSDRQGFAAVPAGARTGPRVAAGMKNVDGFGAEKIGEVKNIKARQDEQDD